MDLLVFMMELDIYYYLEVKYIITFTTGLDYIYNRVRYLISVKKGITYIISHK